MFMRLHNTGLVLLILIIAAGCASGYRTVPAGVAEAGKLRVIRRLLEVAYADHLLHPHELHLISRISKALGIEEKAIEESRSWLRERMRDAMRARVEKFYEHVLSAS